MDTEERLIAETAQANRALGASGQAVGPDPAELKLKKRQVWPPSQINAGYAYLCRQAG
jgi:hypothetical protein